MRINSWVIALLAWGLAFRGAIACFLQPGFDEAYYYVYTLHPSLSYFDHPPLVALTTAIGIWLTGGDVSQFSIRLGGVLLYTGTLFLFYLTSARLFSQKTATLSLAIATTIPFFQVGFGTLTLPDTPLMFFWSACLCLAAYEFFPPPTTSDPGDRDFIYRPTYRIAGIGLLVGLACLGKYHGFILGLGLVLFCLVSPAHRKVLRSPWTLAAIALFAIAISPILIWNWQHDWASFRFQSVRAVPQSGYNFEGLLVTFLAAVGYLFPTFGFPIWWVSLRSLGRILSNLKSQILRSSQAQKQILILSVSLPIFLGFTLMGGYRQILPSWHMPGFFGATLLLGQWAANIQTKYPHRIRNWVWGSGMTIAILLSLALLHVTNGIVQKGGDYAIAGGFWPAKDDPSTQLIDIQQLRQAFKNQSSLATAIANTDFVFSNNFFLAGQIAMAIAPFHKPLTTFDTDLRGFAYWSSASDWVSKNALYVTSDLFKYSDRKNLAELAELGANDLVQKLLPRLVDDKIEALEIYKNLFQAVEKIGEMNIIRGGQPVQVFHIYKCTKLLKPYPRPYGI
ncbi:ArnT family glycosyltransferase [Pseudanabaena sp. PCC 6802]|uniref:ArnT family glycosyltransferase n=1 Tax=Pseudanabaena sp. PCC 6802 TaxID=118173 RepID=UPI0003472CE4|nr:glycosyltransferase family 39 protein [Pseudanabaena sp. PCC 6802]